MKIGFNMLLWTDEVREEHFPIFERLKKAGYDGVEIPVLKGEVTEYKNMGKALKDNGLGCTVVTIIPDESKNPNSVDKKVRASAEDYLKWVIDCSLALGSEIVCGPLYAPVGIFTGMSPTDEEWKRVAEVHRKVAEYAAKSGITLACEFLNRFETYFITTMDQLSAYVKLVDNPFFKAMFDTFHANIEEDNIAKSLERHMEIVAHIHISENHRGIPGSGHIDWEGVFGVISQSNYDGWLTIEAFGRLLPQLATATKMWRDLFSNEEEVYTKGLKLIKENLS